jgi:YesN/AraC family two-component response regulator
VKEKTVLLVEDDDVVRDMIKGALEKEYHVLEAATSSEAISLIRNPIDLALIDYNLPDASGFEVLKAIKTLKPEIPVIIMTAYSTDNLVIKALRSGVTDFIKKPLSFVYLIGKLSQILKGEKKEDTSEGAESREVFIMDCLESFIDENFDQDLTRDKLAEKAHMERYRFSRAFNARFGRSVRSYLNAVRVKKAAELLRKHPDLSVADIAIFVGYGSISHFGKVFKNEYGMSPNRYRRNQPSSLSEK